MLVSGLIMMVVGFLFFYSYLHEDEHPVCMWIMQFSTRFHILPSARGKRYWAVLYGVLAFMWGIGGIVLWFFS